ncbi:sporulation protein, partial [Vibrio natriegens]
MSLFRKSLASLGIGSARVDTLVHQDVLIPGGNLQVEIQIHGGKVSQQIDNIDLYLCCHYRE